MLSRFFLGLLFTATSLTAQTSVWKVARGAHTFYLGGTCHVLRAKDFPLPPEFDAAFAASSAIYFETDLARVQSPEMQTVIATHGLFNDGKNLADVLTPSAWKIVQTYAINAGIPLEQLRMFKPWMLVVIVTASELQKLEVTAEGVDAHYFKKAGTAGKKTGQLESFEQQVEFLIRLGAGHESELIANTLEEIGDLSQQLDDMLAAWRSGDVARLDQLMLHDVRTRYPAVYEDIFVSRNKAWLVKLDELAKTPEVEFVLVGAGHMAGKDGLLAQLRARGYEVEQLKIAAAKK